MRRRRTKLVPEGGVECFEIRAVLYFDEAGDEMVDAEVDTPDRTGVEGIPLHAVLGVLDMARDQIKAEYA